MNNLLLRKSVSSLSSNRITAVASLFHSLNFSSFSSPQSNQNEHFIAGVGITKLPPPTAAGGWRGFHVGSPLSVRASSISSQRTGYAAVADYTDEERSSTTSSDGLEIAKLGISQEIVSALARKGITSLFPIQKAVLEPAMQGRDMIGRARTGTGKTLAFGIPIMDKILQSHAKNGKMRNPMALVLAPTRELAKQVDKEFYEAAPSLDSLCVYGGVPISRQMSALDRGVDVVVGTPGRIIDLLKRGALQLSEVKFIVLDEADQMLNVGFADDVEMILEHLPRKRQSMMFSATMPSWIVKLTQKYLNNPLTIDLVGNSDQKLADGITLYSIASENYDKPSIVGPLIKEHARGGKCIVFTQTKRDADRLAHAMKDFRCEPLHGDITQNQRERTLAGFRDGHFNVLVATDVAARGLDVPNVDLVIHYELPNSSEIFVHRSGRTGRAGKKGNAILIHSINQFRDVKGIEREVGCKFVELPRIAVEPGARIMFGDSGSGFGQSGRGGRFGNSGFGGPGNYGSGAGRFGSYNSPSYDRTGGRSPSYDRTGGFSSSNRPGDGFGGPSSGSSSRFGSDRSGSFGNSNRLSGLGSPSFGRRSGFEEFTSGRSTGFGNQRSSNNSGSRFGSLGEDQDW